MRGVEGGGRIKGKRRRNTEWERFEGRKKRGGSNGTKRKAENGREGRAGQPSVHAPNLKPWIHSCNSIRLCCAFVSYQAYNRPICHSFCVFRNADLAADVFHKILYSVYRNNKLERTY